MTPNDLLHKVLALLRASPSAKLLLHDSKQQESEKKSIKPTAAQNNNIDIISTKFKVEDLYEEFLGHIPITQEMIDDPVYDKYITATHIKNLNESIKKMQKAKFDKFANQLLSQSFSFSKPKNLIIPKTGDIVKSIHDMGLAVDIAKGSGVKIVASKFIQEGSLVFVNTKGLLDKLEPMYPGKVWIMDDMGTIEYTEPKLGNVKSVEKIALPFNVDAIVENEAPTPLKSSNYPKVIILNVNAGWKNLWRYEEARRFTEMLTEEGIQLYRGFFQVYSYTDYDRGVRVFYPFGIHYLVAFWRYFQRHAITAVLDLDKQREYDYIRGWHDANEGSGKQWLAGYNSGYSVGLTKGREESVDEILVSYAHDVIKNQRALSQEEDRFSDIHPMDKI